jgi:hypothetical protein
MKNGLLAMAYLSPATDDPTDDADDSDDWTSQPASQFHSYDDNLGPGPPPPEFLLPPPPLPDFMLEDSRGGECLQRSLPQHLATCDMSFVSPFLLIFLLLSSTHFHVCFM